MYSHGLKNELLLLVVMAKKNTSKFDELIASIRAFLSRAFHYIRTHLWLRIVLITLFTIIFVIFALGATYAFKHRNDPVQIGVSFSKKYADEIQVNWQDNLTALLEDLNFENIRLMSYWDLHEPNQDEYYWNDLDWQMDMAAQNGASVTLAVGLRQPRWPECHYPVWARNLNTTELQSHILDYIEQAVLRYRDHPALESYQVENEVANRHFGDCPEYDRDFYAAEIALIRSLDPDNIVITNTSNQSGVPISSQVGDKVGFSVYKRAHFEALGQQVTWSFWYVPSWWHGARAMVVELIHGAGTFIHELQAEPWGPKPTLEMPVDQQYETMDPSKFIDITNYAERTGMKEYYLWGGEWWYWLLTEENEPSMWETVRSKLNSV